MNLPYRNNDYVEPVVLAHKHRFMQGCNIGCDAFDAQVEYDRMITRRARWDSFKREYGPIMIGLVFVCAITFCIWGLIGAINTEAECRGRGGEMVGRGCYDLGKRL